VELDDEEKDRRAEARRKKELEKMAKQKSTEYVHDSDDDDDNDKDVEFFAREEALRQEIMKAFGKSRTTISMEVDTVTSKKRKAEDSTSRGKRRKTPPKRKAQPFADSDDESDADAQDVAVRSSRAPSLETRDLLQDESEVEDEATDTPLSSQHANGVHESDDDTEMAPAPSSTRKSLDAVMTDDEDDEDEDAPVVRRPMARNKRGGFIIDSDSE
jgi:replication fork protection complex subunit Tof1/Swi1